MIQPNGNIHLHVAPEVSTLDFANSVTVSGTTIPALSTRKAETEFELQDGQSFVIAGLMDNRVTEIMQQDSRSGRHPDSGQFLPQQEPAEKQFGVDGPVHGAPYFAEHAEAEGSAALRSLF